VAAAAGAAAVEVGMTAEDGVAAEAKVDAEEMRILIGSKTLIRKSYSLRLVAN
jgi:hypothetical protein